MIRLLIPCIPAVLVGWYVYVKTTNAEGGVLIDEEGNIVGATIFGICIVVIVFLVAVILGQWRPKASKPIVDSDH